MIEENKIMNLSDGLVLYNDLRERIDLKYTKPANGIPSSDLREQYLIRHQDISGKANISDLSSVAFSGEYSDLLNKPTIPSKISQLIDDSQPYYAICYTSGDTQAKEVSIPKITTLYNGLTITIKFLYPNTATSPVLRVNEFAYYPIQKQGRNSYNEKISWFQDGIVMLTFDGDYWIFNNYVTGYYTKPITGIPASDLAETYLKQSDISGKANSADLATVATSGDYDDLINKPTIPSVPVQDVQVDGTTIVSNGVANIPIANSTTPGIMKVTTGGLGLVINNDKVLLISPADSATIKAGTQGYRPVVPLRQHESIFFGLSKLAGVDLANETVTVGTYSDTAKTAIRSMLGAIGNTDYATSNTGGVVKVGDGSNGIGMVNGQIYILRANSTDIKIGTSNYKSIVPNYLHEAVFYGLAKAAGDTTLSASSNAVGTYTPAAKAAIHTMLDIDNSIVEQYISSAAPTITAMTNCRYICGEITSLDFTPCATGTCEIIFTAGSTLPVVTLPSTVKMPEWYVLETNTTYDIIITNGVYGAVMSWAL